MIRAERFQMIAELGEKDSDGIITLEQLAEYLACFHGDGAARCG